MTKLDQRLAELLAVSKPQVEEIYPDLAGDDYVDAMLQDLYDDVTSQF